MNKLKYIRVILKGRRMNNQVSFKNSKVMLALWWLHRPLARAGKMLRNSLFGIVC